MFTAILLLSKSENNLSICQGEWFFLKKLYIQTMTTPQQRKGINYLYMQQQGWKYYTGQKKPRHSATYLWFHLTKTLKSLIHSTVIENRAVIRVGGWSAKYYLVVQGSINMKFLAWGKYVWPMWWYLDGLT